MTSGSERAAEPITVGRVVTGERTDVAPYQALPAVPPNGLSRRRTSGHR
jgi:hypothetical protein